MQTLPRSAVVATTLSRTWRRGLSPPLPVAERNSHSLLASRTWPRNPRRSVLCSRCSRLQTRMYSSNSSSNVTAATTTSPAAGGGATTTLQRDQTTTTTTTTTTEDTKTKKKKSDPLRVLFCGSDEFSCAALEALHREHVRDPGLVRSIDVVARPGKRTGRGYKVIHHPPIRELATKLGLPVHERDTFTGWDMPPQTNLIIAVSFGLFVPPRLLRAASPYGGLNLHPSALPDLRGPAPLQHALLAGRPRTAVCLQTLDPEAFDRGLVLARSAPVRIAPDDTFEGLRDRVAPLAAELLVRGLREGVHVPPLVEVGVDGIDEGEAGGKGDRELLHAPKITKHDGRIQPEHLPHLWRRYRALGPLWFYSRDRRGARKRVIIEKMSSPSPSPSSPDGRTSLAPKDAPLLVDDAAAFTSPLVGYGGKLALDASRSVASSRAGAEPGVPYLVPLEPEPEPEPDPDADSYSATAHASTTETSSSVKSNESTQAKTRTTAPHLVIWLPEGEVLRGGACWLGGCRIETVKVEGEKAKPAAQALKDFFSLVPAGAGGGKRWAVGSWINK
ncbi:hypothetical protein Hte_009877 [Hypoxylon texense]